jgi:hypothetical protein
MLIRPWLAAFALFISGGSFAQSTLEELSQKGGKKMTGEELQQLHAGGVTFKGVTRNGFEFQQLNKADGTVVGQQVTTRVRLEISGAWKIDDQGKLCMALKLNGTGRASNSSTNIDYCTYIWKQGDKYYAVDGDTPQSTASPREFVK